MTKRSTTAKTTTVPGTYAGVITHTYIRLRGAQQGHEITVHHARTSSARVTLSWAGLLMSFLNAEAAQGVLEALSAARATLQYLPAEIPPVPHEPYSTPAVVVDWSSRPGYAVMPKNTVTPDKRRTIRWTEVYMGPITFQILDRAAFHSTVEILRDVHSTAAAVCPDGERYDQDPTRDSYQPPK